MRVDNRRVLVTAWQEPSAYSDPIGCLELDILKLRAEVRQLVIARNERRMRHGEEPLDVEAEVERQVADFIGLGN